MPERDEHLAKLRRRRVAFQASFGGETGQLVLDDLGRFCGAATSSFVPGDPCYTAFNEGKREVLNHIVRCADSDDAVLERIADKLEQDEEEPINRE